MYKSLLIVLAIVLVIELSRNKEDREEMFI
jgi:hypothetical protein